MATISDRSPEHGAPVEPLAPEDQAPRLEESARAPRGLRLAMAGLALAFLLVPGVVFVAGGAGRPLPRERTARTPSPSRGWTFFDDTGHYFTQRLPFRDRAVDANSWVVRHVFGTRPKYGNAGTGPDHALPFGGVRRDRGAGDVQNGGAQAGEAVAAEGRHHWLFLQGELDVTCRPPVGFQTALSRWNALLRILRASGRRAVLVVVPEKSTIYPEYLEPETPSRACALRQKARLWRIIETGGGAGFVPLRRRFLALKRAYPRDLLYLPLDSHWNDLGALVGVEEALAHLGRRVRVGPRDVGVGRKSYTGDITAFVAGGPKRGSAPIVAIHRPGADRVRSRPLPRGATLTTWSGAPGRGLPGTTVFLADSFGIPMAPILAHYAARMVIWPFLAFEPSRIAGLIRSARTVVIETAERDFLKRAASGLEESVVSPAFLRALPARIGRAP